MRREIRIAGSGGQGIILSGFLLGKAATIHDNRNSTQVQSYGPEARGGASKTEVIISDDPIYFPYIVMADIFVAFSQLAYDKYRREVKKDALTFIDPHFVVSTMNKYIEVPATEIAIKLGSKMVANVVMLSTIISLTNIVSIEAFVNAIKTTVNSAYIEMNLKAVEKGIEISEKMNKDQILEINKFNR